MFTTIFWQFQTIVEDIDNGIGGTKVKPGIIGEVGCSLPLAEFEKRSLRAAAIAQSQTKTPVMIHPGRDPTAPFEDLRIFQEAGGDSKHTVIAHLGRTISKKDTLLELAETGVFDILYCIKLSWTSGELGTDKAIQYMYTVQFRFLLELPQEMILTEPLGRTVKN